MAEMSYHSLWLTLLSAMLAAAAWRDYAAQRIPNLVSLTGAAAGLVLSMLPSGIGFVSALLGLMAGFSMLMPFYLIRVMGAGDLKLLAAVGAFVGIPGVLGVALITFLAGGALSLAWAIRYRIFRSVLGNLQAGLSAGLAHAAARTRPSAGDFPVSMVRVPYAFAIAIGSVSYLLSSNRIGWNSFF